MFVAISCGNSNPRRISMKKYRLAVAGVAIGTALGFAFPHEAHGQKWETMSGSDHIKVWAAALSTVKVGNIEYFLVIECNAARGRSREEAYFYSSHYTKERDETTPPLGAEVAISGKNFKGESSHEREYLSAGLYSMSSTWHADLDEEFIAALLAVEGEVIEVGVSEYLMGEFGQETYVFHRQGLEGALASSRAKCGIK